MATALSMVAHERLRKVYDAAAMNEARVYPGRWHGGHNSDSLDWLLQALSELSHFTEVPLIAGTRLSNTSVGALTVDIL